MAITDDNISTYGDLPGLPELDPMSQLRHVPRLKDAWLRATTDSLMLLPEVPDAIVGVGRVARVALDLARHPEVAAAKVRQGGERVLGVQTDISGPTLSQMGHFSVADRLPQRVAIIGDRLSGEGRDHITALAEAVAHAWHEGVRIRQGFRRTDREFQPGSLLVASLVTGFDSAGALISRIEADYQPVEG